MRLFIAEKPSLGRAIAESLGISSKSQGYITCGPDVVTWCFGHLFELYNPDDYDPSWSSWSIVPVVPPSWRMKPRKDCAAQIEIIGGLLRQAATVVNAGDPDREGQLLVDEVLEHFDYQGPVERIWLASLDARSVAKALSSLTSNARHAPLRDAARARSQADWLIGLNATRALTNMGRDAGISATLSLGRVQTPVLNLVVTRDREISAFKPQDYMVLQGHFEHPSGQFAAKFVPGELQTGLDAQGRLIDLTATESIIKVVRGKQGNIAAVAKENKQKAPPLPYCLSSLQKAASARWSMTAQQVLDVAQRLYEKKLTTYPRSDCSYLPVEQWDDAGHILTALACQPGLEKAAHGADPQIKSNAWNTAKVTAHHAIIPTGDLPGTLSAEELAVYEMIAIAYILQFYPSMRYVSQKIQVKVVDTLWEATGRHITDLGWTSVAHEDEEDAQQEKEQPLPAVVQADIVTCADVCIQKKKTTPPPRFNEGTLIEAMANIHRFVEDAAAKATLRENEGIGTEATRAGILETLKKRGYLIPQGKALVSTRLAGQVVDLTPLGLKDPVTTAKWESRLQSIAEGKDSLEAFMADQLQALPGLLEPLLSGQASIKTDGPIFPCPTCGKPLQKRQSETGPYWSCFRKDLHPDGKPVFFPDDRGRPGAQKRGPEQTDFKCEKCGTALQHLKGKKKNGAGTYDFFKCPNCATTFNNVAGKPTEREAPKDSGFECPDCGKPLRPFKGISKRTRKVFSVFNCSGYPVCKASFFEKDGKPDFPTQK